MTSHHMNLISSVCYWISGALCGYGIHGFVFAWKRQKIVHEIKTEILKEVEKELDNEHGPNILHFPSGRK